MKAIKGGVRSRFPLFWFDFHREERDPAVRGVRQALPELSDQDSLANLHEFAHGGEKDGLAHLVAEEYRDVETEIASIERRVDDNKKASKRLKEKKPPDLDQEDRLKDLDRERRALRMIRDEIQKGDNLAFLTDRGILPNYAFPEAGVTLKAILFPGGGGRRRGATSDGHGIHPVCCERAYRVCTRRELLRTGTQAEGRPDRPVGLAHRILARLSRLHPYRTSGNGDD